MTSLDSQSQAARHGLRRTGPSVRFMEGALLGNGGMGVVVCVRPESIVMHFGHNDVWDIRLAEANRDAIGTFEEVFRRVDAIGKGGEAASLTDDPWFAEYMRLTRENYARPYPRPMPCGSVILGFDRGECEPLGYELDISDGLCRIDLIYKGQRVFVHIMVELQSDRLWVSCAAEGGGTCQPFTRVHVLPDRDTPSEFPSPQAHQDPHTIGFVQILPRTTGEPYQAPGDDQSFRLLARFPGTKLDAGSWPSHDWRRTELTESTGTLERLFADGDSFGAIIDLDHSRTADLPVARTAPTAGSFLAEWQSARSESKAVWGGYWNASSVALSDQTLERYWYRNLYFMRCATRPGTTCPGLFANWSYRGIGSSWHGDYHMNYNTQQPFWMTFSSNHLELNLPYVDLVHHITPVARTWASDYYHLRGAYYPHSAYPVEMTMNPYPVPTWGWEVHETPWTVQGLWWHYVYSMDADFLRERAFGPIRDACRFVADYMMRPDAQGERFGDNRFHIFPTVPPELYGLRLNFAMNHDAHADVTLTRFLFAAFAEASAVLGMESAESELLSDIAAILDRFPDLALGDGPDGTVWTPAPGAPATLVQNCPASTMAIFPGEEVGLHSDPEKLGLARRSLAVQRNEGGNDLVFLNMQRARAGVLDLEQFKRQLDYCEMPNGTCTNMVLQGKGRYSDTTAFDFMADMGVWFENFAIPAVINECLMQSYDGIIHVFPNWPMGADARFENLRAAGAFLVSAVLENSAVVSVSVHSEAGGVCRLWNPWKGAMMLVDAGGERLLEADQIVTVGMQPGQTVAFRAARIY